MYNITMMMRRTSHEQTRKKQKKNFVFPFSSGVFLMPTPFRAISNSKNVHFHFSMRYDAGVRVRVCFSEFAGIQ